MATTLTVNGIGYSFPQTSDQSWGDNVTNWATAITNGMLQKAGGSFSLTAEVDFGTSFGLKSLYYKSSAANPASAGQIRLANADLIKFRNAANAGDLAFGAGSADAIPSWGSIDLVNLSTAQTLTNKTISGSSNTLSNIADGSLTTSYLKADGSRALSANWAAGAFQISLNSLLLGSSANTISALRTIASDTSLTFQANGSTTFGSISAAGAWVVGASGGTQTHTVNGPLSITGNTTVSKTGTGITANFTLNNAEASTVSSGAQAIIRTNEVTNSDATLWYNVSGALSFVTGIDTSASTYVISRNSNTPGTNDVMTIDHSTGATTFLADISLAGAAKKVGFFGSTGAVKSAAYTITNVTTDRTYDANATTVDELADVLGTLIAYLQSIGLVG